MRRELAQEILAHFNGTDGAGECDAMSGCWYAEELKRMIEAVADGWVLMKVEEEVDAA